jgi:hypothetical protein
MRKFNPMILIPKKLRPPQMWWVIEQQARRRRAVLEEPSAPATAVWLPHETVATWDTDAGAFDGDWNEFSLVDPASVLALNLNYSEITSLAGLENLTALEYLSVNYTESSFEITAFPASLNTLEASYSGLTSLPDLTTTPNLTWINLHYSSYLEGQDDFKLTLMQQLDANEKTNGFLDIGNFNTGTPGAAAAIGALTGKGWTVNV